MQEFYKHGVPNNANDMKAADTVTLQQQQQQETNYNPMSLYNNQYQRLVIVFRRGKYVEYKKDSGRSVSHQQLIQAPWKNLMRRQYTFGAIENELVEKTIYFRGQLLEMGAIK